MRMSMTSCFDHLDERFIHKEVQFRIFGLPMKASCPPAVNVYKTPQKASCYTMTHTGRTNN